MTDLILTRTTYYTNSSPLNEDYFARWLPAAISFTLVDLSKSMFTSGDLPESVPVGYAINE